MMNMRKGKVPRPAWFILIFFSIFGFIGLTLLIFLWFGSGDGFGDPPLIFKLVGSFISLGFMAMGFGMPITAILAWSKGEIVAEEEAGVETADGAKASPAGYRCPHCAAGLGAQQEVSPSGDVKCGYCNKWWNIHRPGV
jgi:hypothetical protein